jgi:spore coat protein CotH
MSLNFGAFVALGLTLAACGSGEKPSPPDASGAGHGGSAVGSGTAGALPAGSATGTNGGSPAGAAAVSGGATSGSAGANAGGGAPVIDTASDEIYDPTNLPRFDLVLPVESVTALGQDPDTYVHGSLSYAGQTVADIGVRIKGEGSLRTLAEKPAFKLKFDEFVDKQAFHGLRRLTLNNMVEDPSFLAERLAYHFFRLADLPAPRCNSALVYLNNEFLGVYANVEAEDKTFLRRWFSNDGGNLYEEGQVDFEPGAEVKFDLETNEAVNDRTDLKALIAAVQGAAPATWLEDVGSALDVQHFLAFTAAEGAVNQWDMYGYTVFYPNNFRLYSDPTAKKFVFLPWGMDMSMKPFRDSGKPHIDLLSLAREGDSQNGKVSAGLMFQRCLSSAPCKAAYVETAGKLTTLYEGAGLGALAEQYYNQIKDQVALDTRKEYSISQFEAGYKSLRATITGRPAAMRESLED